MANPLTDLDCLEIVAALSRSSAHITDEQREALRAVITLAGTAILNGWQLEVKEPE